MKFRSKRQCGLERKEECWREVFVCPGRAFRGKVSTIRNESGGVGEGHRGEVFENDSSDVDDVG